MYIQWTLEGKKQFDEELRTIDSAISTDINKLGIAFKKQQDLTATREIKTLLLEAITGIKICEEALQQVDSTTYQSQYAIFSGDNTQKAQSLKSALIAKLSDVLTIQKGLIKTSTSENFANKLLYKKITDTKIQLSSLNGELRSMQFVFDAIKANQAELEKILQII